MLTKGKNYDKIHYIITNTIYLGGLHMYCRHCGKEMDSGAVVCTNCGVPLNKGKKYCSNCGAETNEEAVFCVKCGHAFSKPEDTEGAKSKVVAGLLGIFLGSLGIHNFYLGYKNKAIAQLLVTILGSLLCCGTGVIVSGVWGLVEGIMILSGSIKEDAMGLKLKD